MKTTSVLQALKTTPDPRGQQEQQYPLFSPLAILLLAVMHGKRSLRGMWLWVKRRQRQFLKSPALWPARVCSLSLLQ